jgi:hypothetical protein
MIDERLGWALIGLVLVATIVSFICAPSPTSERIRE